MASAVLASWLNPQSHPVAQQSPMSLWRHSFPSLQQLFQTFSSLLSPPSPLLPPLPSGGSPSPTDSQMKQGHELTRVPSALLCSPPTMLDYVPFILVRVNSLHSYSVLSSVRLFTCSSNMYCYYVLGSGNTMGVKLIRASRREAVN